MTANTGRMARVALCVAVWVAASCAAFAETGQTNVVDGVTTNTSNLVIGNGGGFNLTIVTNAGVINNTGSGRIGILATGNTNTVIVTGGGSIWTNTTILRVGDGGSFNNLQILSGGVVYNTSGTIGNPASSIGNSVTVDGNGSTWANSANLFVGNQGSDNQLTIANSGLVYNVSSFIGARSAATGNSLTVTGSGSVWSNTSSVTLGRGGDGNYIVITNGGRVISTGFSVGISWIGNPGHSNIVTVTGNGSVWTNTTAAVTVGGTGTGNQLRILDGGKVVNTGLNSILGNTGTDNMVLVSGNGSRWELVGGANLNIGNAAGSTGNQLVISNQGTVTMQTLTLANNAASSGNSVLVTGQDSLLSNTVNIIVGARGYGNQFTIADGGRVVNNVMTVGNNASASNNTLLVTGMDSVLENTSGSEPFTIGSSGSSNQMIIADGGLVISSLGVVGRQSTSRNNRVLVTDNGSVWTNASSLTVGDGGFGNQLVISNGGKVYSTAPASGIGVSAIGGNAAGGSNNTVVITGTNSLWNNNGGLTLGIQGGGNQLWVINGGQLDSSGGSLVVGNGAGPDNSLTITNGGVVKATTINVGPSGSGNQLVIISGGILKANTLTVGGGGSLLASNTTGQIEAAVITTGAVKVVNSTMTWGSNVVIRGTYTSDPSTNVFLTDATVTQSGVLQGGMGGRFEFQANLLIQSTNNLNFKLDDSSVAFTGEVLHTNTITGADLGGANTAYDAAFAYGTNFAYGELHLGSTTDIVCFLSGNSAPSNALYVGWLDLLGSTNYVANLIAPTTINIYYAADDTRNAYLGGLTYQLKDHLGGTGGLLLPVAPEPSALSLLALAACAIMRRRRGDR